MTVLQDGPDGVRLNVYVQPRASKTEIVGIHDDAIRIRVAAPPVDGEANKELLGFLRKIMGVRRSDIEILMGDGGRRKTVRVRNRTVEDVKESFGLRRLD